MHAEAESDPRVLLRYCLELSALAATLVLAVFELHDDWDLFRVGYLYPLHFLAFCLELLHGQQCEITNVNAIIHANTVTSKQNNRLRLCFASMWAAVGALLADLLVLGQGLRPLEHHRAASEFVQLALVIVLLAASVVRLVGFHSDHVHGIFSCAKILTVTKAGERAPLVPLAPTRV